MESKPEVEQIQVENDTRAQNDRQYADSVNCTQKSMFEKQVAEAPKEATHIELPVNIPPEEAAKILSLEEDPENLKEVRVSELEAAILGEKPHLEELERYLSNENVEAEYKKQEEEFLTASIKPPEFDEDEEDEEKKEPAEEEDENYGGQGGIEEIFALAQDARKEAEEMDKAVAGVEVEENKTNPVPSVNEIVNEELSADKKKEERLSDTKPPIERTPPPAESYKEEVEKSPESLAFAEEMSPEKDLSIGTPNPALSSDELPGSRQSLKEGKGASKKISKEEEKLLDTKGVIGMLERMMADPGNAGSSEQVEDMILELHKLTTHTNGNVPLNFKAKLAAFVNSISPTMAKPTVRKSRPKTATVAPDFTRQDNKDLPEYLRKDIKDPSAIREYRELMEMYHNSLVGISAKEIAEFKSDMNPSKATVKIGFALVLLLKELDNTMVVDTSKRAALSKQWSTVQTCLSKVGHIAQLLRRVLSFLESDKCQYDRLEQSLRGYVDVPISELAEARKKETTYIHTYMNAVMKYMEFVARTKEYGKKVQQAKILKEEKTLLRERMKQNAIKGVGAKNKIVNDIIKNSPRQMTKFETKVNMMVYEEGEKASEELRKAEQAMEERKRYVKELNRKKKSLLNQMEKEQEEKKRKEKEEDDRNYMLYQQELREKLRIFLADKLREDKTYKSQMLNEHLFYAKLGKVKALSELKKQWLEEFQKTLEKQEFDKKLEEIKLKEKQVIHKEFIEKMMRDKEYKRELYLAEKLLEHEGRVVERQKDMQFKESLLQKEQEQLEEELEFLYKCSKAK